jgi:hypothetical protein
MPTSKKTGKNAGPKRGGTCGVTNANINSLTQSGGLDLTSALKSFGTDSIQKTLFDPRLNASKGGNTMSLNIDSLLKNVPLSAKTAQQYGAATNACLNKLTPGGAKKIFKLLKDKTVMHGGQSPLGFIGSMLGQNTNIVKDILKSPSTGMNTKQGGNTSGVANVFFDEIDVVNKSKLAAAIGVKEPHIMTGGSLASAFVESLMNEAGYATIGKHFDNTIKSGGNIEAYDKLFKEASFKEFSVKNINAVGGKSKKKVKGGYGTDAAQDAQDALDKQYPHLNSIKGFPGQVPYATDTIEMVKYDTMADSIESLKNSAEALDKGLNQNFESTRVRMQFGGKSKTHRKK